MAHNIALTVSNHVISLPSDAATVVDGAVEHYTITTTFDDEWVDVAKRVFFTNDKIMNPIGPMAYTDGMDIPAAAICAPGRLRFTFIGIGDDGKEKIITRHMSKGVAVNPSGAVETQCQIDEEKDLIVQAQEAQAELDAKITAAVVKTDVAAAAAIEAAALASAAAGAKFPVFKYISPDLYVDVPADANYDFEIRNGDLYLEVVE